MELMLNAHPEITGVSSGNDEMALGAIQALKDAGRLDDAALQTPTWPPTPGVSIDIQKCDTQLTHAGSCLVDLSLAGRRGVIPVYVGVPDGDGPWPAVLVVSDALGITPNLRDQVDWLASVGYLAAAPDLVEKGLRTRCLFSTMKQALKGQGAVFDDFDTVRGWLANHSASTGRVAAAGFCFDGGFALLLAGRGGFDVAGSGYDAFTMGALTSLARSCPVVGRRKELGGRLRKEPAQIAEVLWAHSVPHDLEAYSPAGHSFTNDHLDVAMPKFELILGEMSASEDSVQCTRRRIRSFFDSHMARYGV